MSKPAKKVKQKLPRGRPSKFTQELADEIVERVSVGEPMAEVCRLAHMPGLRTVYDWMEAHPAFSARVARARVSGYDMIAQEVLRIVDEQPPIVDFQGGSRMDAAYVAWQRSRADARLKLLAKWDPKRYGDKFAMEGAVTHTHGFPEAFAEAMKRASNEQRTAGSIVSDSTTH